MSVTRINSRDFEWSVPVAIVGAGACGLSAALAARDSGAEVLVIERDRQPFGSTGMSYGGICAAGSHAQESAGIDDSAQLLFEDIVTATRGQTDEALARVIADRSAEAVDWLVAKHGINLTVEESWTGLGHRHPRLHAPANRSGATLMTMLLNACERSHADIINNARVTNLYANEASEVLGLRLEHPDGSHEELGCRSLILATCGFGANPEMIHNYIPAMRDARYYGHEGNTGDGICWGLELGGDFADMGSYQALGSLADPQSVVLPHTLLIGGGVQVNSDGCRFENELDNISGQALTILDQPGGVCWIVYDQRRHDDAMERFQDYRDAEEIRTAKRANSWQELAGQTGIEAAGLIETMREQNRLCDHEATDTFGRKFEPNQALQPPYFAARVTGALFHTQGGLCVDSSARVVTQSGKPLPNLFAGGGAARSVSGPGEWGYLPGMGLCTAVTLGRIAGLSAAEMTAAAQ